MTRIDEKEKEKREREGGGERARRSMESLVLSRFVDPLASRSPIDKSRRGSMRDRRAIDYGEGGEGDEPRAAVDDSVCIGRRKLSAITRYSTGL